LRRKTKYLLFHTHSKNLINVHQIGFEIFIIVETASAWQAGGEGSATADGIPQATIDKPESLPGLMTLDYMG
jgi:hypothetical protein